MKRAGTPALKPDPRYMEAFAEIMSRIQKSFDRRKKPVAVYVAGGAALHLYTGARFSGDIDAHIDVNRYLLPDNLEVTYEGPDGRPRHLYFDTSYNESFALLHEDVHRDSLSIQVPGVDPRILDVRLFSPVDLAVSKLARFEAHDQEDIQAIALAGLMTQAQFRQRAEEALTGYSGVVDRVRSSLDLACKMLAKLPAPTPSRLPPARP
jgi:hypothetical protein